VFAVGAQVQEAALNESIIGATYSLGLLAPCQLDELGGSMVSFQKRIWSPSSAIRVQSSMSQNSGSKISTTYQSSLHCLSNSYQEAPAWHNTTMLKRNEKTHKDTDNFLVTV
jgi:hypothetical protein